MILTAKTPLIEIDITISDDASMDQLVEAFRTIAAALGYMRETVDDCMPRSEHW